MSAEKVQQACDRVYDALILAEPSPSRQSSERGSKSRRLPYNPKLAEATRDLKATLVSWARLIAEEGGFAIDCRDEVLGVAGWVCAHADWLGAHEAVEDFLIEVDRDVKGVLRCVDRGDDRVFVGMHAGMPVYAKPEAKTVTLPSGEVRTVEELREHLRHATLKERLTAHEVSIILRELHAVPVTAKQILNMYATDRRRRDAGRLGRHEGLDHAGVDGRQPLFVVEEVRTRWAKAGQQNLDRLA